MYWILWTILLTSILSSTFTAVSTSDCSVEYDGYCHTFITNTTGVSWKEARSDCISRGGDLSTIVSSTQNSQFSSSVTSSSSICWIGLNDITNDAGTDGSNFVWADGSTSTYRSFYSSEPSGGSSEDCVIFYYDGSWWDLSCSNKYTCYFCEKAVPTVGCSVVYDGYCHTFISNTTGVSWEEARTDCISRGGDLSTIVSSTQNSQFSSSVTSISSSICWIGLNDITNDAGTYGSNFVWADGSTSTYRSFYYNQPSGGSSKDCVIFYYYGSWWDNLCSSKYTCYFCEASIPIFGRVVGVFNYEPLNNNTILTSGTTLFCITETGSGQITWSFQDGQSSTTTDVTSQSNWDSTDRISTLYACPELTGRYSCRVTRKSSYTIYTALGASTLVTLTNDISTTIHTSIYPCTNTVTVRVLSLNIHLQSNLEGRWKRPNNVYVHSKSIRFPVFTYNDGGLYSFYQSENSPHSTEVLTIQIQLLPTGTYFAKEISGEYMQIPNNAIFYADTTLVCAINTSQRIQWTYKPTQTDTNTIISSSSSPYSGVSTLNIRTSSSGFYMCSVGSYIAAIFNPEYTIRAKDQMSYNYIKQIDPTNVQIICDPDSSSHSLNNIKWNYQYNNPLILYDQTFSSPRTFVCRVNTWYNILSITLSIQEPKLTITYPGSTAETFTTLSPRVIQIKIPLTSTQVRLSANFASGTWILPQSTVSDATTYSIQDFTLASIGRYSFSTTQTWNGRKSQIFILDIGITEPEIATRSSAIYQPIQNNTLLENDSEIACFTTYQNAGISSIKWYYQKTVASEPQAENALFNSEIGASSLYVVKDGFYTCHVPNTQGITTLFSIGKFSLTNKTESVNDDYFAESQSKTYIRGQSFVFIYRNPNVTISSIRWTTDKVKNGDTDTSIEFLNPVDVSDVFSRMGPGAYTFSCFYRQSPITIVGNIEMDLKDTAYIQLSYGTTVREFGDLNNENFPSLQSINIQILTQKLKLNCEINKCDLVISINGKQELSTSGGEYNIEVLRIEDQGLYALRRYTADDVSYLTANFLLNVTGFVEQRIISLKHSDLNGSSIIIFWEVETVLPEKAEQVFRISYNGTKETFTKSTAETFYNLTDLIPGETYTIYVTLSYAYTFKTSNKSVTITLSHKLPVTAPASASTTAPVIYIIPSGVAAISIVILACILLITIISCKIKKRKRQKIEKEDSTIDSVKSKIENTKGTKSKGKKADVTKYSNIEELDTHDIPLEDLRKPAHFYSSIEESANILLKGPKPTYYSNLSEFPITNFDQPPNSEFKASDYTPSESTEIEYNQTPYFNQGTLGPNKHPDDVHIASDQQLEVSGGEDIYYAPTKALELRKFHDEPKSTNIPANRFRETYQKYMKTGDGETSKMEEEYDKLTLNTQAFHEEIIEAIKPENDIKNPIKDILPFEDNRVVLESPYLEGDYINASHVCNYQLIATMHPTTETLADFLQMLYQTEPSMVIMLATKKEKAKMIGDLSERKAYWPKEGKNLECHPFSVSIVEKLEAEASIIKQELLIKHEVEKKNRTVLQCISAVWNDDGTPSDLNNVIALLGQMIHQKETEPLKPIIIHCGDGITKTGILLTIFNVVQELKLKKPINIYNAVRKLRRQRMQMVPTLVCYTACYVLMNEYCSIHL